MKEFTRKDLAPTEVFEHVKAYLGEHLPEYELLFVVRYSDYEGDDYLYMVVAKLLDTTYGQYYAAWTCWNEKTQFAKNGTNDIANLQCACKMCNRFKDSILPEDFLPRITEIFIYQMNQNYGNSHRWKIIRGILKGIANES